MLLVFWGAWKCAQAVVIWELCGTRSNYGAKELGGGRAQNKLDLLALPLKARYKFLNARDKAAGWLSLKLIKREKTYRPLNPLKYIKVG